MRPTKTICQYALLGLLVCISFLAAAQQKAAYFKNGDNYNYSVVNAFGANPYSGYTISPATSNFTETPFINNDTPGISSTVSMSSVNNGDMPGTCEGIYFEFGFEKLSRTVTDKSLFEFKYDNKTILTGTLQGNTLRLRRYFDGTGQKYFDYVLYDRLFDILYDQPSSIWTPINYTNAGDAGNYFYELGIFMTAETMWIEVKNWLPPGTSHNTYNSPVQSAHSPVFWGLNVPGSPDFANVFSKFVQRDSKARVTNKFSFKAGSPNISTNDYYMRIGCFNVADFKRIQADYIDSFNRPRSNARLSAVAEETPQQESPESFISVSPNPVTDNYVDVTFKDNPAEPIQLTLRNQNGVSILSQPGRLPDGRNTIRLQLPASISNGLYFITAQGKNRKEAKKLIIMR